MSSTASHDGAIATYKGTESVDIEQQGRPIALDSGLPKSLGAGVSSKSWYIQDENITDS